MYCCSRLALHLANQLQSRCCREIVTKRQFAHSMHRGTQARAALLQLTASAARRPQAPNASVRQSLTTAGSVSPQKPRCAARSHCRATELRARLVGVSQRSADSRRCSTTTRFSRLRPRPQRADLSPRRPTDGNRCTGAVSVLKPCSTAAALSAAVPRRSQLSTSRRPLHAHGRVPRQPADSAGRWPQESVTLPSGTRRSTISKR